jgi:uncharacterized membrane protein YphA (DoxX/SURF4 family)
MKAASIVLRILLGGFFLWSGAMKLLDLKSFVETVANYHLLDRPYDAYLAYFVPCLEMIVGAALLSGVFLNGGVLLYGLMILGFSTAIAWVWYQGLNINCGCFGKSDKPTNYPLHLAINAGLFLAVAGLFWTVRCLNVRKSA